MLPLTQTARLTKLLISVIRSSVNDRMLQAIYASVATVLTLHSNPVDTFMH